MSKITETYFSIRLLEKLKEYAISLEGNTQTKNRISTSRFEKLWFIPIPLGIIFWTFYIFLTIKLISNGIEDILLFLLFLPYIFLLIALIILLVKKDMVLVYSWKELVYYPIIAILTMIVFGISLFLANVIGETHSTFVILFICFGLAIPALWLFYILIRNIVVNKRHPFMSMVLGIIKLAIWLFILLTIGSKQKKGKS